MLSITERIGIVLACQSVPIERYEVQGDETLVSAAMFDSRQPPSLPPSAPSPSQSDSVTTHVENVRKGIYYVEGDKSPTQILVSAELPEEENVWLTSLRNDLTEEQIRRVLAAAEGREKIDAYLYTIADANAEIIGELFMRKKEGVIISEKLDGYFRERYAPLIAEGRAEGESKGEAKIGRQPFKTSIFWFFVHWRFVLRCCLRKGRQVWREEVHGGSAARRDS